MAKDIFEELKNTIKDKKELDQQMESAISEEEIAKISAQLSELDVKISNLLKDCLLDESNS